MESNLRPLSLGELLDAAIYIYRKNFITLFGVVALVNAPVLVLQVLATLLALPGNLSLATFGGTAPPATSTLVLLAYYAVLVGLSILGAVFGVFQIGALAAAVSEAYHRRASSVKQAYVKALGRWPSLLIAFVILGGIGMVLVGFFFGSFILLSLSPALLGPTSPASLAAAMLAPLMCLGIVPGLILFLFFATRLAFTFHIIVLENLNAGTALRRSWNLVGGQFWRVLFTLAILVLFVYLVTIGPVYLTQFAVLALIPTSFAWMTVISTISQSVISALVTPVEFAVLTLLYYDLRIRKEGYDLELQAVQLEGTVLPVMAGRAV